MSERTCLAAGIRNTSTLDIRNILACRALPVERQTLFFRIAPDTVIILRAIALTRVMKTQESHGCALTISGIVRVGVIPAPVAYTVIAAVRSTVAFLSFIKDTVTA
jgi:hypothetical protein